MRPSPKDYITDTLALDIETRFLDHTGEQSFERIRTELTQTWEKRESDSMPKHSGG